MDNWISCKDKLPEKSGYYLVTVASNFTKDRGVSMAGFHPDLFKVDEYDFANKKGVGGWYDYDSENGHYLVDDVVAWMPIPNPYKGD